MRFALLGPLEITADDGTAVELRGHKVRALAAVLLCRANQPVHPETLVDALWGTTPPQQVAGSLRVHVHHLRQALGDGRVDRRAEGYRLRVGPGELDVDEFRALVAQGRAAMAGGDPSAAATAFRAALQLWRGPALAGFDDVVALGGDAYSLEEQRLQALEQRFEADLGCARHDEIGSELRDLVARHPFRETFRGQLMRALAGSGRAAEAIAVFDDIRRLLADELGLNPGAQLRDLHLSILRDDATLVPAAKPAPEHAAKPAPAAVVPRQLPADVAGFTGRAGHLRRLDTLLPAGGDTTAAMPVATVSGVAGIGKTTLAVHWAHLVKDRFPDGQLHVNLHGFDPSRAPVAPAAALGVLLAALGVPARRIPLEEEERAGLYRTMLADRRVLVLLDNAHDAAQVRPLLPGSGGCLVVVTSRNLLTGLVAAGAQPVVLDLFDDGEARELLRARAGAVRTAAEPAAVADILARCGGLPLALSVVASRAAVLAAAPLSALADDLRRSRSTLDGFASDDVTVDLRAVFSWSYRVLGAVAARMFRLLALHPGPDVTVAAAASLAGLAPPEARSAVAELRAANLLGEARPGRYAYHDLIRAYATELTERLDTAGDRAAAVRRVLEHHVHTAYPATLLIDPNQTPTAIGPAAAGVTPEPLGDRQEALAWFDAERAVLVSAVLRAADGFEAQTWQLAWSMVIYLDRSGHWQDKLTVLSAALAATRRAGERRTEARTLRSIGRTLGRQHRFDEAHPHLRAAVQLYQDLGDVNGQAHATGSLAEILEYEGRFREALDLAGEARQLFRSVGNPVGEGRSLGGVGSLHLLMGEYEQTITACRGALELFVAAGDTAGQAGVHDTLGVAHHHLGRHDDAAASFAHALDALERTGERYYVAVVLHHLGDARLAAGAPAEARAAWRRALDIFEQLGSRDAAEVQAKLAAVTAATPA